MDFSEEMIDEILKIFQVESEEIISKLNNSLLNLEKNPNDKDSILVLFRDAHTLKGASRMVGFNNVQTVAHKMEDVLGLAKENKILLNSKVVDVLYKTVDFLSELIQKSIEKGEEIYSEDISKYVAMLEKVQDSTEAVDVEVEQIDFDAKLFGENIDKINNLIPQCLFILMEIETQKDEKLIQELLDVIKDLYEIFQKIGSFDIKKGFEDIMVKLEFITKASNSLTNSETGEIQAIIEKIINTILPICEIYRFEVVDYYAVAFEKMSQNLEITVQEPVEKNPEIIEPTVVEEKIPSPEPTIIDNIWKPAERAGLIRKRDDAQVDDFAFVKSMVENLSKGSVSLTDIKNSLMDFERNCENEIVKQIFQKNIKILDFSIDNEIKLDEETLSVLKQSMEHCDNILENKSEAVDKELILQRLEIIQQILELNNKSSNEQNFVAKNRYKIRQKKVQDLSDVFNTGDIKTLRVESSKLDVLINQINEIMVTKIKAKKHSLELTNIKEELEQWQRSSTKALNYLKYYDKKYFQSGAGDTQISFFIKQLLNLFSDNNKKVQGVVGNISSLQRTIQEDDTKVSVIVDNLEQMVRNIRVLPLATVFHLFGRMVRDIAKEKNKEIDLEIIGSETSTDKKIIEEIKTPLIHIIRNAIDHGIETPEERIALGKAPNGKILLSARQLDNKVIIRIEDDGRGLNIEKIKNKALQKGFLRQEEIDSMSNEQITNLIFVPGFSTGEEITNISGRGIGLDIVQTKISQLNGQIKLMSEVNKGCCVQIELPTTMSTIKVFLVKSAGQTFAIPMDVINTVLRKEKDEIISNKKERAIVIKGKTVPLCDLADILNLKKTVFNKTKETIIIIENNDKIMALCVDKLIGDQEILHKKLSAPFYKLKNISGITTLVSGETCLILNVSNIIKAGISSKTQTDLISTQKSSENRDYNILLVDDSITTSTLEKNILTKAGYQIEIAQNPIEAFEKMKNCRFDLIVSDLEMPEMDGFEFLERIKTNEMFSEIPVIILSSLAPEVNEKRVLELGAEKYIFKHEFNQDELQEVIGKIFNK